MTSSIVSTEAELRRIIKPPPGTVTAKINSGPLTPLSSEFLALARLGVLVVGAEGHAPRSIVIGGSAGFVTQDPSQGHILVPLADDQGTVLASLSSSSPFAGLLLVVPGVSYSLRLNGDASLSDDRRTLSVVPKQSYAHCAKAFIRSALWEERVEEDPVHGHATEPTGPRLDDDAIEFLKSSPFATIGTSLVGSDADVSPRGDPSGFVHVIDRNQLFIPERPGNRIADSLRNIIANQIASVLFMIPGDHRVLEVSGKAMVTTASELRAATEINGKIPKLGVLLEVNAAHLRYEPALLASQAWDTANHASATELPTIGALVADPSGERSVIKRVLTGLTDQAVAFDYRRNLY